MSIRTEPPPLGEAQENEPGWKPSDLKNADGTVTRILWIAPGAGNHLNTLLQADPVWTAAHPKTVPPPAPNTPIAPMFRDPNIGPFKEPNTLMGIQGWKDHAGAEPLLLSGTPEAVEAAHALASHVLTSIPQIAIEARVVEVLETDESALGTNWFLLNADDHDFNPANPNAPLGRTDTIFDRSRLGRGVPTLPGTSVFVPNFLTELGTIVGDVQLDLLVSALKSFTKVDVVNAPNVAVLSGHTATISAGTEVPTFELNLYGANTVVTTKFKKIGVTMDVLPSLIRADTIRMAVQVRVENIIGGVTVSGGGTSAVNPIVASRSATTTLDVRDGSTVIFGGLLSTGRTGVEDKIPVLGEIPILEVLFSSTHRQDTHSNLIFFLRPKVITAAGRASSTLITPPPEGPGEGR